MILVGLFLCVKFEFYVCCLGLQQQSEQLTYCEIIRTLNDYYQSLVKTTFIFLLEKLRASYGLDKAQLIVIITNVILFLCNCIVFY